MPSSAHPAAGLSDEQAVARHLVELLMQEQAHLISANIDALVIVTEEKTKLVAQLSGLGSSRYQALAACGHAPNETGMRDWVNSATDNSSAGESWAALLALAESAKELNRINGMLISTHMVHTQTAINALNGNRKSSNFYGPDGQTTARTLGRGIIAG